MHKKDAGSLYTVAKNYGEVYDAICSGSGQEKEADGIAVAEEIVLTLVMQRHILWMTHQIPWMRL